MRIQPYTSFLLDALRVIAALGVVLCHIGDSNTRLLTVGDLPFGNAFVVGFFVLSGYVIAATSNRQRMDGRRYVSVRLARLWSVAIPCLAIGYALELLGQKLAPEHYAWFDRGHRELRYAAAASFTNELWFFSAGPSSNRPVWSLAYEACYYALFGLGVFVRPLFLRLILLLLAAAVIGPKILALLPIWLLGALAWKAREHAAVFARFRWPLLAGSLAIIVCYAVVQPRWPIKDQSAPWFFSSSCLSDLLLGFGLAGAIAGADLAFGAKSAPPFANVVRAVADMSFSLYLLHYPLMIFAGGVIPRNHSDLWPTVLILGAVFLFIGVFAHFVEPSRKWIAPKIETFLRRWPEPVTVAPKSQADPVILP